MHHAFKRLTLLCDSPVGTTKNKQNRGRRLQTGRAQMGREKRWGGIVCQEREFKIFWIPQANNQTATWKHEHEFVNTTTRWDNYPLQVINWTWHLVREKSTVRFTTSHVSHRVRQSSDEQGEKLGSHDYMQIDSVQIF